MRIKKFNCHHCGAPKVNAYSSPWVVCDYCFHMIDIDFTMANAIWTEDEEKTKQSEWDKEKTDKICKRYIEEENKEAYRNAKYQYWARFYKAFPKLLTPNIPKGVKLKAFVNAIANAEVDAMQWENWGLYKPLRKARQSLKFYAKDDKEYVKYESFKPYFAEYMKLQERIFRTQYDNPANRIFKESVPEEFQRKMRISEMVQKWVPFLEQPDADLFLKQYNVEQEYVEIPEPVRENITCKDCKKELSVPKGALLCICEHCRHENVLRKSINCHSCGHEHEITSDWKNIFNCVSCSTELRVVTPIYDK